MQGLKAPKELFVRYCNELIYFFLFIKIILFHLLTDTPMSSGVYSTSLGFLFIFYAMSYFFRNKGRLIFSYAVSFFIGLLLLSNTLYLDYYSSPVTIATFYQTSNLSGLGDSILYLFQPEYAVYFLDLLVLPFFIFKRSFVYKKRTSIVKGVIPFAVLGVMGLFMKPVKLMLIDKLENPVKAYDSLDQTVQYGIMGHHALDTYFHVRDTNFNLSSEDRQLIEEQLNKKEENSKETKYEGFGKGKNLILIQVESLQHFVLDKKVNRQEITPTLNKMMDHSISFPNFYAQTIGGNSSDAEFLTQTSLFPTNSGSVFFRYSSNTYHSLANGLKENGYGTFAVHADEKTFWNRHEMYPSLGFEKYVTIEQFPQKEMVGMGVGDKEMFTETARILSRQQQPFYSFIVTLTNHMPYEIEAEKQSLTLPPELNDTLLGNYFQTVRYTDEALGLFLDSLKEKNLLEDSLIVLYGDHNGIFHRDKQQVEKWIQRDITDDEWYKEYATVPFMIYHPSIKGEVSQTIGGQIDVSPTLKSIMAIGMEKEDAMLGSDLLRTDSHSVLIPSGGYVEKALSITDTGIKNGLSGDQERLLEISNMIIKGDYFDHK
jgi:lipoteichoic acid synthase